MKTLICFFFTCFFVYSCIYDPASETFTVVNNSDSAIYVYYGCSDSIMLEPRLVLYEPIQQNGKNYRVPDYRIESNEHKTIFAFGNRKIFTESCNNKSIKFFFITENTMRTNTWTKIYENQLYDTKFELTYQDLEKLKWTITFKRN